MSLTDSGSETKETKLQNILESIKSYGTSGVVNATINRLSEKETWNDFVKDYPHGKAINPFTIKSIIITIFKKLFKLNGKSR
jgi:hypothetical protein